MLMRGLHYEGWRPADKPVREHTAAAFLEHVRVEARHSRLDPEATVRAVFGLLAERVSAGEIDDVKSILPRPIRAWWPE